MVIMVVPGVIVEYFLVVLVQGHPHVGASTAIHSIESEEVGTCYRCCEETWCRKTNKYWSGLLLLWTAAGPEPVSQRDGLKLQGDYYISGFFPLHDMEGPSSGWPILEDCKEGTVNQHGYHLAQAMRFAVEEINRRSGPRRPLLPGVRLGYRLYDVCSLQASILATIDVLRDQEQGDQRASPPPGQDTVAVIGPDSSSKTMALAVLTGAYLVPQISYESSNERLSNKKVYPSFFRTIPSDKIQVAALIQLLVRFRWTWIALLGSDNAYGLQGMQSLSQQAAYHDICIAYQAVLPKRTATNAQTLRDMVDRILKTNVETVVLFSSKSRVKGFFPIVVERNVTGKVWLGTEDWVPAALIAEIPGVSTIGTVLGVSVKYDAIPGFGEFERKMSKSADTGDFSEVPSSPIGECLQTSDMYDLAAGQHPLDTYDMASSYNVYRAVYAVAHALRRTLGCDGGACRMRQVHPWQVRRVPPWQVRRVHPWQVRRVHPWQVRRVPPWQVRRVPPWQVRRVHPWQAVSACSSFTFSHPNQLLPWLRKVQFTVGNSSMYFDENGDPPTGYDIVAWIWRGNNWTIRKVGSYTPLPSTLTLDTSRIEWSHPGDPGSVPLSICSPDCDFGHRRLQTGQHKCCFDCLACPAATFLNKTGATSCQPCPEEEWAPPKSEACLRRTVLFLAWDAPLSIALLLLLAATLLLTTASSVVLLLHLSTPVVKSAGGRTCLLMLAALTAAAASALCHFGPPTRPGCLLKRPLFVVSFAVCLACVTVRAFQVVCIFKLSSRLPRAYDTWAKNRGPECTILLLSGTALGVSLLRVAADPPRPAADLRFYPDHVVLECSNTLSPGASAELAGAALLSGLCFSLSYMGKDLPANYNEAKCVAFSLVVCMVSWIGYFTLHLVSRDPFTMAVNVFAILSSVLGVFGGYFLPKVYIILLRPQMNTSAHFQNCIQMYTMNKQQ
ncbi:Taste receptor type 1 member 2 [Merluccius polli]|uniref:Taste receptor type 1 member 2 n=1 Tax=Merluccius polli TaxID=89951 RepID=A0AA47MWI7_MERPO|nr:Taste receptor type 1 member 2 [Merluccius polli]